MPIPSVAEYLIRHRCALAADVLVIAYANDTALRPPIYWCLFFAADVIGLALPTDVELGFGGGLLFGFRFFRNSIGRPVLD